MSCPNLAMCFRISCSLSLPKIIHHPSIHNNDFVSTLRRGPCIPSIHSRIIRHTVVLSYITRSCLVNKSYVSVWCTAVLSPPSTIFIISIQLARSRVAADDDDGSRDKYPKGGAQDQRSWYRYKTETRAVHK